MTSTRAAKRTRTHTAQASTTTPWSGLPTGLWRDIAVRGDLVDIGRLGSTSKSIRDALTDPRLFPNFCPRVTNQGERCPLIMARHVAPWNKPQYCEQYCYDSIEQQADVNRDYVQELEDAAREADIDALEKLWIEYFQVPSRKADFLREIRDIIWPDTVTHHDLASLFQLVGARVAWLEILLHGEFQFMQQLDNDSRFSDLHPWAEVLPLTASEQQYIFDLLLQELTNMTMGAVGTDSTVWGDATGQAWTVAQFADVFKDSDLAMNAQQRKTLVGWIQGVGGRLVAELQNSEHKFNKDVPRLYEHLTDVARQFLTPQESEAAFDEWPLLLMSGTLYPSSSSD